MEKILRSIKYIFYSFVAILIVSAAILVFAPKNIETLIIERHPFALELAVSDSEKARGLSGRKELCENCGMIFMFKESGRHSFWMKDMNFDLDIIWIDRGEVTGIEKNISRSSSESYGEAYLSDQVIELPAGSVDKFGIEIGSQVTRS